MIAIAALIAVFACQVDTSASDRKALVEHLKAWNSSSARASALKGTRVTVGKMVNGVAEIVPSSSQEFFLQIGACVAEPPRGGKSWRDDGTSEFSVDWSCVGKDTVVTQITMRDGKVIGLNWTRGPVVILAAPPVAR